MKASGIEISTRLKEVRAALSLNQKEFASKSGVGASTYQKYEMGLSVPGGEAMEGFARLDISTNWLLTGEGPMFISDLLSDAIQDLRGVESLQKILNDVQSGKRPPGQPLQVQEPDPPPYGFVLVPRYDVAASMGNGAVIHSEQVVDHLAFRAEWIRTELSANPKNLVLISAIGDSMEPTLRAGDLLLIDRCNAGVKQDAIYAFATNGELRVKRMQLKIDGSVVVKSDNPQYEAEILTSDQAASLRIVGRVVWSGRRM